MNTKGFTLIEISVVMAITVILLTLTTISLISFQQNAFVDTTVEQLISDMKYQQMSAMNGAADGESTAQKFGIHFETNSYTLFHGDSLNVSEPTNFTISLESAMSFADVTFPQDEIIFEKGSGEINGFVDGQNTIIIQDSSNTNQVTITINKLGVITQIQ